MLALLGIHLASRAGERGFAVSNIAAANAVEALAVWWTYQRRLGWGERHERLPGSRKLRRWKDAEPPSFGEAISRSFYVVQPMRIGTLDPLATFGLVNAPSRRFNSYSVAPRGESLLEEACPAARTTLESWVTGGELPYQYNATINDIDPTQPVVPLAAEILLEGFLSGGERERRRRDAALKWVSALRSHAEGHASWNNRPHDISEEHWHDMRAGSHFGLLLTAAGAVDTGSLLDHVEAALAQMGKREIALGELPRLLPTEPIAEVRRRAVHFLDLRHDPSPDGMATRLCIDCLVRDDADMLSRLIERDGRILRLVDGKVLPGPAFAGRTLAFDRSDTAALLSDEEEDRAEEAPVGVLPPLPDGISYRVGNLFHLAPDLLGIADGRRTA
ncbi:hypothetical protein OH818_08095 [Jiella pelagia]|uniref:Uncharacterized protein n=1 Tax=Jiella pelagia TaxID=2986949 RepID=A0ABY7C4Z3_9HYPH|nr:hypothetical protein OH818_08095 [Jiella pelagia]